MNVKYFSDTDTALLEFSDADVAETREINENIFMDIGTDGQLISMTIEHAKKNTDIPQFSYKEFTGTETLSTL